MNIDVDARDPRSLAVGGGARVGGMNIDPALQDLTYNIYLSDNLEDLSKDFHVQICITMNVRDLFRWRHSCDQSQGVV